MAAAGCILRTRDEILDRPVFILTSDVDWASDYCIESFVSFALGRGVRPTLFVTHQSPALAALQAANSIEFGIHPNFMAGSSHGADPATVIASLLSIVPEPVAARSHHYIDSSEIVRGLAASGLRIDSNVCLFLQSGLKPQHHWSGLIRLPCFWEDDVHWDRGFAWDFAPLRCAFLTPGLKILNVHPFMFALNIPDATAYARHKHLIPTLSAESAGPLRFQGPGPATYLAALIDCVHAEGYSFTSISKLVTELRPEWICP